MKKFNLVLIAAFIIAVAHSQSVADFENLSLPADTFWDGSDLSGGFISGSAHFNNDYDTTYFSWSGFTYSSKKDTSSPGFSNQYSAITGAGFNGSNTYVVADEYGNAKVQLLGNAAGNPVTGFYVTNGTYPYHSMLNGDAFSKKFGGPTGTDPDWFKLTVRGWSADTLKNEVVEFYLADYRSSDSTQDYIVKTWQWVDLRPLGNVDSIQFFLSSSDTGSFGMNTPAYFCIDNFVTADPNDQAPVAYDDLVTINYEQDILVDVLANDFDTTDTPLTVQVIGGPNIPGASAIVTPTNKLWYTPAIGVVANDSITYLVCDMQGKCDTGLLLVDITALTGINGLEGLHASLFPNPFTNSLTIRASGIKEVKMYDVEGRVVRDISEAPNEENVELNTTNLAPGTYVVKIISDRGLAVTKVVRQ